ncbi:MAG: sigma 54-interacting transcriptional regulator [Candidatus Poribacteria bacterium]|nr:sigma 54-interacting transcriptional regulator [Candidatus Poribacteria bacterium]
MRGVAADRTATYLSREMEGPVWATDPMTGYLSKEEYLTLLKISQTINSLLDLDEILDQSLQLLATVIKASASTIWLIKESTQKLYVASATGEKSEEMKVIRLDIGQGIVGIAVKEGKAIITDDARHEKHHAKEIAEMLDLEIRTMICVPMSSKGRRLGAIQAMNKTDKQVFNHKDIFMLSVVANSIAIALENARLYRYIHDENHDLRRKLGTLEFRDIITRGEKMKKVLELAERVAQTNSTVLIRGESGTGKELVAESIHNASLRKDKPFIAVNCAALPGELLASEMFGHERGSFTGAIGRKEGRFELADGGTLFLDEIGDMPISLQATLLRVSENRSFYRVGGTKKITCDVRIVAATNQDLEAKIKDVTFREDLYYRLNVITISLPPLRERVEDIEVLTDYFLIKYIMETKRKKSGFTPQAMKLLMNHPWRGNVRELENAIEHAIVLGVTDEIQPDDLPLSLHEKDKVRVTYGDPLEEAQRQFKKEHIEKILRRTKGNRSRAAEILQIQRTYLSRLIKELIIQITPSATV